jgi:hypothetical protein
MAFQTGPYTDQNNLADLWRAFLLADAWTINSFVDDSSKYSGDTFTGKRLHVYKQIDGVDCYFNFRTTSNQRVFEYSPYSNVTGICCNFSTGYNAGNSWDTQPGHTTQTESNSESSGGCLDSVIPTGGTYSFFADNNSASMAVTTNSANGELRFITIGLTDSGKVAYSASGGTSSAVAGTTYDFRSFYMLAWTGSANSNHNALYDPVSGEQFHGTLTNNGASGNVSFSVMANNGQIGNSYAYVTYSPEPFRGNAPLPPFEFIVSETNRNTSRSAGVIGGVNFVNMTNLTDGQSLTIGSDVFNCFRIFSPYPMGVAFKK